MDGDRLVQAICCFSAADEVCPTPNLFDPRTGAITAVGEAYRAYVNALAD